MKKQKTLGGSVFVHNAIEFDYCIAESLSSLCAVCDEVVAADAESTDETIDLLRYVREKNANLLIVEGLKWDANDDFHRLSRLANAAMSFLKTDWHFMLQADEVIHESSFEAIRNAVQNDCGLKSFFCRRVNLYGDLDHCLRFDLPQSKKPCSDEIIRLATIDNKAFSDAESLRVDPKHLSRMFCEKILIFHYGFVRRDRQFIEKVNDMQSWFQGAGSIVDPRIAGMSCVGEFDWRKFFDESDLMQIPSSHPFFSTHWAEARQLSKPFKVKP